MSSSPHQNQPSEPSADPDVEKAVSSTPQPEPIDDAEQVVAADRDKTKAESKTKSQGRSQRTRRRKKAEGGDTDLEAASAPEKVTSELPLSTEAKTVSLAEKSEIHLIAPLDTVGTENYLRYGVEGPRHYVMGLVESTPTPEDITIQLEIAGTDGTSKVSIGDIRLKRLAHEPQQRTVWGIRYAKFQVEIIWVWDFFRMLSSIQVRVAMPQESASSDDRWATLAGRLQAVTVGDKLIIRVRNSVGTITQVHEVKT